MHEKNWVQNRSNNGDTKCFQRSTQYSIMLILAEIQSLIPFTIIRSISACKPSRSLLKRLFPLDWCFFPLSMQYIVWRIQSQTNRNLWKKHKDLLCLGETSIQTGKKKRWMKIITKSYKLYYYFKNEILNVCHVHCGNVKW